MKDLGTADVMEKLTALLDNKGFLRDDKYNAYKAYKSWFFKKRTEHTKISDYILEFNNRYNKAKKYEMALTEACFEDTGQCRTLLTKETITSIYFNSLYVNNW